MFIMVLINYYGYYARVLLKLPILVWWRMSTANVEKGYSVGTQAHPCSTGKRALDIKCRRPPNPVEAVWTSNTNTGRPSMCIYTHTKKTIKKQWNQNLTTTKAYLGPHKERNFLAKKIKRAKSSFSYLNF